MKPLDYVWACLLSLLIHAGFLLADGPGQEPETIPFAAGRSSVELTLVPAPSVQPAPVQVPKPAVQEVPVPLLPEPQQLENPAVPEVEEEVVEVADPTENVPLPVEDPVPESVPVEATPSPERYADLLEKGVVLDAVVELPVRPVYPKLSRRLGEEGEVRLTFRVDAQGSAHDILLERGSGSHRLDGAAWTAVEATQFKVPRHASLRQGLTFIFTLE